MLESFFLPSSVVLRGMQVLWITQNCNTKMPTSVLWAFAFCLVDSLHTCKLHFPHLLLTLWSLALGQIRHLFSYWLASCHVAELWLLSLHTFPALPMIGVCCCWQPSTRLIMNVVTSSFESSLRKSCCAFVLPLQNSGCWAVKKM